MNIDYSTDILRQVERLKDYRPAQAIFTYTEDDVLIITEHMADEGRYLWIRLCRDFEWTLHNISNVWRLVLDYNH